MLLHSNRLPLKLHHVAEVADDELRSMAAGIDVELVRDAT